MQTSTAERRWERRKLLIESTKAPVEIRRPEGIERRHVDIIVESPLYLFVAKRAIKGSALTSTVLSDATPAALATISRTREGAPISVSFSEFTARGDFADLLLSAISKEISHVQAQDAN